MRIRPGPASTSLSVLAVACACAVASCSPSPATPGPQDRFIPAQTVPAPIPPRVTLPAQAAGDVDARLSCSLVPGTGRPADPWVLMPVAGRRFNVTGCTRDGQVAWFVILVRGETGGAIVAAAQTTTGAVRLVQAVVDGPVTAHFVDSTGGEVDSAVWGNALSSGRAIPLAALGNPAEGLRFGAATTGAGFDVEVDLRPRSP